MSEEQRRARAFLAGERLSYPEADALWQQLKAEGYISDARAVLARMRKPGAVEGAPGTRAQQERRAQQEALLTSKDEEIVASIRHDKALAILTNTFFDLDDPSLDGDGETLGIAGGILKRRWEQLGQTDDLLKAADYYRRGSGPELGSDAYPHINSAFLDDLLASVGDEPDKRHDRARAMRTRILNDLPAVPGDWFNTATRAEAHFGLGNYEAAADVLATATPPEPWELETTTRQLAAIAHLREERPFDHPHVRLCFEQLLGGSATAAQTAMVGKVGLALSGGGFRASFYHLGVLARLAELGVLRRVEVLSCVSGGSILGACYWLALRREMMAGPTIDYVKLVRDLIEHFETAVATDLRNQVQVTKLKALWRVAGRGAKGALDSLEVADALEAHFYRPLLPGPGPLYMHDLRFDPYGHDTERSGEFNPTRHNWARADKVPALVLNATTVNTGHAWQFTPTWMGESPWSVHQDADSVPRLQWAWYEPDVGWQMPLGKAVAASACVPGVFSPVEIDGMYPNVKVQLVDGGIYDNQGTTALLAHSCNVLLVSDAAGQLTMEDEPEAGLKGLADYAVRSMDTLKERIRQANFMDLSAREQTRLVRGLMILHMKAGLTPALIRLPFSQVAFSEDLSPLSPSGIRRDLQQALAELRTDLDAFSLNESRCLMACGYQMASKAFARDLARIGGLADAPRETTWPFQEHLEEITSTATTTAHRSGLLQALQEGSKVRL